MSYFFSWQQAVESFLQQAVESFMQQVVESLSQVLVESQHTVVESAADAESAAFLLPQEVTPKANATATAAKNTFVFIIQIIALNCYIISAWQR